MSTRTKARLAGTLLALVAVWPLAHRQLVTRYDVNPWKLYGFAMYCTPHLVAVDLIDRTRPPARRIPPEELPAALRERYERYVARRSTLGWFVPPQDLARDVLAALPEVGDLGVAVTVSRLPFAGTELESRTRFYRFPRQ